MLYYTCVYMHMHVYTCMCAYNTHTYIYVLLFCNLLFHSEIVILIHCISEIFSDCLQWVRHYATGTGEQPWRIFPWQHQQIYIVLFNDHIKFLSGKFCFVLFCFVLVTSPLVIDTEVIFSLRYCTQCSSVLIYLCKYICANAFGGSFLKEYWRSRGTCIF